jgi:nitrogen fixation NifU-like protein
MPLVAIDCRGRIETVNSWKIAKMYSQKYLEHFQSPKNLGKIDNPTATTAVKYKGQGCFDRITMFAKIESDIVEDLRYQVRGCSGTIAACSALSVLVKGKSVAIVKELSRDDVVAELDGIPEQKEHSVQLALEALDNILNTYHRQTPR